jgi:hypothetical protein
MWNRSELQLATPLLFSNISSGMSKQARVAAIVLRRRKTGRRIVQIGRKGGATNQDDFSKFLEPEKIHHSDLGRHVL